jgi:hypothetical protein
VENVEGDSGFGEHSVELRAGECGDERHVDRSFIARHARVAPVDA